MPMPQLFVLLGTLHSSLITRNDFTSGDLANVTVAVLIGLLSNVVMFVLRASDRRELTQLRKDDLARRNQQAELEKQEQQRQEGQRARRESRQSVHDEIKPALVRLEEIESKVCVLGPLDSKAIDAAELDLTQCKFEAMARRYPALDVPLLKVAAAVETLRNIVVLSDLEATHEYQQALNLAHSNDPRSEVPAREIGIAAVAQSRAAVAPQAALAAVWTALGVEGGDEI
jgi:hypothetical protein